MAGHEKPFSVESALIEHVDLSRAEKRRKKHYEKRKEKQKLKKASRDNGESSDSAELTPRAAEGSAANPVAAGTVELAISRGKGLGLFATKAISHGETVMIENPLLLLSSELTAENIIKAIRELPPYKLSQYTNLSYESSNISRGSYPPPPDAYNRFLYSIWDINTFSCPLGARAVYAKASRVNHSCTPNVQFSHKSDKATMITHALKDIKVGEELTWSYVDVCHPSKVRQQLLDSACPDMGACLCTTCSKATPSDMHYLEISDQRRIRISELRDCLSSEDWHGSFHTLKKYWLWSLELEALLKAEGLEGLQLAACYHVMAFSRARHGLHAAVGYKKKEMEVLTICFGSDSPRAAVCQSEIHQLEAGIPGANFLHGAGPDRYADAGFPSVGYRW